MRVSGCQAPLGLRAAGFLLWSNRGRTDSPGEKEEEAKEHGLCGKHSSMCRDGTRDGGQGHAGLQVTSMVLSVLSYKEGTMPRLQRLHRAGLPFSLCVPDCKPTGLWGCTSQCVV